MSDPPRFFPPPDVLPVTLICTTLGITFCTIGANELPSFGSRSIGALSTFMERGGFCPFSSPEVAPNAAEPLEINAAAATAPAHTEILLFEFIGLNLRHQGARLSFHNPCPN